MDDKKTLSKTTALYIPHGGGPLPLLNHSGHKSLIRFLKEIGKKLQPPSAIIVISAHWEQSIPSLTAGESPPLIYDYSGFPPEAYEIEYPAPGSPGLAEKLVSMLENAGIHSRLENRWGFDHGMYVPLKLMYPDARIPCIQLSMVNGLDPKQHIELGRALRPIAGGNILILGSGFSFHNMREFGRQEPDPKNIAFDNWLKETMTDPGLSPSERKHRLIHWEEAPHARYCHPREDHLIPLHVCYGLAQAPADLVFNDIVLGKKSCAFLWKSG